jgi:hypothetical protein
VALDEAQEQAKRQKANAIPKAIDMLGCERRIILLPFLRNKVLWMDGRL